jgi:hypothetical protein
MRVSNSRDRAESSEETQNRWIKGPMQGVIPKEESYAFDSYAEPNNRIPRF